MRAGVSVTCKGEGLFTLVKMQVTLLTLVLVATQVSALSDLSDIPGHYCSTRRIPCCTARQDECSLPIMGTVCYCDQFCDREVNDDCCPDYAPVCLNRTRTTTQRPTFRPTPNPQLRGCEYKGRSYERGQGVKINCNQCKCDLKCRSRTDCVLEFSCEQNPCLMDPKLIASINSDNLGWRATNYSQFWGRTLDEGLSRRLGTRHSKRRAYSMRPINSVFDRDRVRARLFYDLRSERPDMISPPLDQGWCAADWVISTVQVATDRLMLMSKGEDRAVLSPQHLLSCNSKSQRGCDGGHLTRAWKFIQKFGLVPEACYPWVGRQTNCSISKQRDKRRTMARCSSGNNLMPLHRTGPAYRVSKEPESIMNEILISGPVQATMKVTDDFFTYQSGVYRCAGGRYSRTHRNETYHAVRIIGWGEEIQQGRPVKYWIVSNSWGTWWGEKGFFRITRGVNECEIESLVLASWINAITPKRDPLMPTMDRANMLSNRLL